MASFTNFRRPPYPRTFHMKVTGLLLFMLVAMVANGQDATWKQYYDSAQLYWGSNWPKVTNLLKQAEQSALSDLGIYDESYLTIVNDLGLAYWQNKEYANAEKSLTRSLEIKREIYSPQDAEIYRSMSNLAGLYAAQGDDNRAKPLYKKIVSTPPAALEPDVVWKSGENLVGLYERFHQLDSAVTTLTQLKHYGALGRSTPHLELQLIEGRLARKLGDYEAAHTILDSLVHNENLHTPSNSLLYIQSLQELGLLYLATGSFNKAEKTLLQAFRLFKSRPLQEKIILTELLNNLASVYEKLNVDDKAIAYYNDALATCDEISGPNTLPCVTIMSNLAGIFLREGNIKGAIERYETIRSQLESKPGESVKVFYITVLNNLATAYRKDHQYEKASEYLRKAYQLVQQLKMEQDDLAATVMNNMAVLYTAQGKLQEASRYYEKAYDIKRAIYGDNSVLLMDLSSNRAVILWALGKPDAAIVMFQKSINLAIRQIRYTFPNLNEDEQIQFYQKLKEDFERFNAIALQTRPQRPDLLTAVFNQQVIIKSLLFFTQQQRNDLIQKKNDSVLTKQFELLRERREQLGHYYVLSLKEQLLVNYSVSDLEKEIDVLEKTISLKTSETVAERLMEKEITWQDLQKRLLPDEAIVEVVRFRKYDFKAFTENFSDRISFGFTDSVFYAALITSRETPSNPALILMKNGNHLEKRLLNYYRNTLKFEVVDEHSYDNYWSPIAKHLSGKSKIFFAGDGVYHKLNLNTMRDPASGKFVIEEYDVHYLLNAAQYLEKKQTAFARQDAVLVGDPLFDMQVTASMKTNKEAERFEPLPGAQLELEKINAILKSKKWTTELYSKKNATEKNLKTIRAPEVLHIATHGFFSTEAVRLNTATKNDFLFHSGLVLAGADRELGEETEASDDDGILTAYEVMNLDLTHTNLVVLSACETGLGKVENGEGVYGLQRSFLQAGARDVMISLWKVDDHYTQQLMSAFYFHLLEGKSKRDALKSAQLQLQRITPNPYHWGGFIMVGVD